MELNDAGRRKEPRFPIRTGATVEVHNNGQVVGGTTVDISESGVLVRFGEPAQLAAGDQVMCEFAVPDDADKALPYWGMGVVVRVDDCLAAIELKAGGLVPLESETDSTKPAVPESEA